MTAIKRKNVSPDIETPVLDLSHRESFSFSPSSPGSPIAKEYSFQRQSSEFHLKLMSAMKNICLLTCVFFFCAADVEQVISQTRLHPMQIWLLGCTLPVVYTRPVPTLPSSPSINGIVLMDPHTFINRMVPFR